MFGSSSQLSADIVDVESFHSMGEQQAVIALPPDGLCFYHAYNAAQNVYTWKSLPLHKKEEMARATKQKMLSLVSKAEDAARLSGDGADSYPGSDDFKYLISLLKVERGVDMALPYVSEGDSEMGPVHVGGDYPLAFQLLHRDVEDGAGHRSPHYDLIQTWLTPIEERDSLAALREELSQSAEPIEGLDKRRQWPVALASEIQFDRDEEDLKSSMLRVSQSTERLPPPREGVVAEAERVSVRTRKQNPTWNDDLVRLATAAVVVCNLRASDISLVELVALVWLCLGGVRIRAHKGYLRYFDNEQGVWRPYSGLLPEGIFTYMRSFLNTLEGMFRQFSGQVKGKEVDNNKQLRDVASSYMFVFTELPRHILD